MIMIRFDAMNLFTIIILMEIQWYAKCSGDYA